MNEQNNSKKPQKSYTLTPLYLKVIALAVAIIIVLHIAFFFYQKMIPNNIQSQIAEQKAQIQKLQSDIQILIQGKNISNDNLAGVEITHLVRMADIILSTQGDVKAAIDFLEIAKQYANSMGLPQIFHALAKDIAMLQNITLVDKEKLVLRLDGLNQKILNLQPIPSKLNLTEDPIIKPANLKPSEYLSLSTWKTILENLKKALEKIIIVRRQETLPLPTPEQYANLKVNIQSKILQAEWAVLNHNNKIYQNSITQVISIINQYFLMQNPETQNIIKNLAELKNIDINSNLPNLSAASVIAEELANIKTELSPKEPNTTKELKEPKTESPQNKEEPPPPTAKLL